MSSEFDPWPTQEPPPDFAGRIVALEQQRRGQRRWRRRLLVAAPVVMAAAAALALWLRGADEGEVIAEQRREVKLARGVAVLEPGAQLRWRGLRVEQPRGEVFYRIDRGAPYHIETPGGAVDVTGTCFRVRIHGTGEEVPRGTGGDKDEESMKNIGKIGAGVVAGALLTVGVYEGKVRVSSAGQRQELEAGGSVTVGGKQAQKGGASAPAAEAEKEAAAAAASRGSDYEEANRNLVETIQQLNRRISDAEEKKQKLQKELEQAQVALDRAGAKHGDKPARHEFDLDQDDWKKLAETGTVKFRTPCFRKPDWQPPPEQLTSLGLAPDDAPALKEAYQKSNRRLWSTIRPLCAAALGNETAVDKIGPDTCIHLIVDMNRETDREGWAEAVRQVGEVRAGLRPEPSEEILKNPVYKVFSAMTGESKNFEADLAQNLGPEEAHRVTFSDSLCAGRSTFGGPGPRGKLLRGLAGDDEGVVAFEDAGGAVGVELPGVVPVQADDGAVLVEHQVGVLAEGLAVVLARDGDPEELGAALVGEEILDDLEGAEVLEAAHQEHGSEGRHVDHRVAADLGEVVVVLGGDQLGADADVGVQLAEGQHRERRLEVAPRVVGDEGEDHGERGLGGAAALQGVAAPRVASHEEDPGVLRGGALQVRDDHGLHGQVAGVQEEVLEGRRGAGAPAQDQQVILHLVAP